MELYHASKQWSERPDDQRFLSLEELQTAVLQRKMESWTSPQRMEDMRIIPIEGGDLIVRAENKAEGKEVDLKPTNWAFGQLCQSVGLIRNSGAFMGISQLGQTAPRFAGSDTDVAINAKTPFPDIVSGPMRRLAVSHARNRVDCPKLKFLSEFRSYFRFGLLEAFLDLLLFGELELPV